MCRRKGDASTGILLTGPPCPCSEQTSGVPKRKVAIAVMRSVAPCKSTGETCGLSRNEIVADSCSTAWSSAVPVLSILIAVLVVGTAYMMEYFPPDSPMVLRDDDAGSSSVSGHGVPHTIASTAAFSSRVRVMVSSSSGDEDIECTAGLVRLSFGDHVRNLL